MIWVVTGVIDRDEFESAFHLSHSDQVVRPLSQAQTHEVAHVVGGRSGFGASEATSWRQREGWQ
jgi:hypothetical protein